jgi:16S rRNA (cytidine1402-2'-O)-methyltransferase
VREITKKFETVHKGTAFELKTQFLDQEPRGEIVLIIQGTKKEKTQDLTEMAFELVENGISKKSAYQLISKLGFVDKKRLYQSSQE